MPLPPIEDNDDWRKRIGAAMADDDDAWRERVRAQMATASTQPVTQPAAAPAAAPGGFQFGVQAVPPAPQPGIVDTTPKREAQPSLRLETLPDVGDFGDTGALADFPGAQRVDEGQFQRWYGNVASSQGLDPNPDDPRHFYDYRAAFRSGVRSPDEAGHFPSQFKLEGHPRMVVDGIDTRTGLSAPPAPPPGPRRSFPSDRELFPPEPGVAGRGLPLMSQPLPGTTQFSPEANERLRSFANEDLRRGIIDNATDPNELRLFLAREQLPQHVKEPTIPGIGEVGGTGGGLSRLDQFIAKAQAGPAGQTFADLPASIALALGADPEFRVGGSPTLGEIAVQSQTSQGVLDRIPAKDTGDAIARGAGGAFSLLADFATGIKPSSKLRHLFPTRALGEQSSRALGPLLSKVVRPTNRASKMGIGLAAAAPGIVAPRAALGAIRGDISPGEALSQVAGSPVTLPLELALAPGQAVEDVATGGAPGLERAIETLGLLGAMAVPHKGKSEVGRVAEPSEKGATGPKIPRRLFRKRPAPPTKPPVVPTAEPGVEAPPVLPKGAPAPTKFDQPEPTKRLQVPEETRTRDAQGREFVSIAPPKEKPDALRQVAPEEVKVQPEAQKGVEAAPEAVKKGKVGAAKGKAPETVGPPSVPPVGAGKPIPPGPETGAKAERLKGPTPGKQPKPEPSAPTEVTKGEAVVIPEGRKEGGGKPEPKAAPAKSSFIPPSDTVIDGKTLQEAARPVFLKRKDLYTQASLIAQRSAGMTLPSARIMSSKARGVQKLVKQITELDKQIEALEDKYAKAERTGTPEPKETKEVEKPKVLYETSVTDDLLAAHKTAANQHEAATRRLIDLNNGFLDVGGGIGNKKKVIHEFGAKSWSDFLVMREKARALVEELQVERDRLHEAIQAQKTPIEKETKDAQVKEVAKAPQEEAGAAAIADKKLPPIEEVKYEPADLDAVAEASPQRKPQRALEKESKANRQERLKVQERMRAMRNAARGKPDVAKMLKEVRRGISGKGARKKRAQHEESNILRVVRKDPKYAALEKKHTRLEKEYYGEGGLQTRNDAIEAEQNKYVEGVVAERGAEFRSKLEQYPWWEVDQVVKGLSAEATPTFRRGNQFAQEAESPQLRIARDVLTEKMKNVVALKTEGEVVPTEAVLQKHRKLFGGRKAPPPPKVPLKRELKLLGSSVVKLEQRAELPTDYRAKAHSIENLPEGYAAPRDTHKNLGTLKQFIRTVPEFKIDPTFEVIADGKGLKYKDGGTYKWADSKLLGILLPKGVKDGQKVRIDPKEVQNTSAKSEKLFVAIPVSGKAKAAPAEKPPQPKPFKRAPGVSPKRGTQFDKDQEPTFLGAAPAPTGYPSGVKQPPAKFAADLMEGTRRLKATARFKRVLGRTRSRFVRTTNTDRIEVGDVRNQRTVAHELGHALDYAIHSKATMRSIAARAGTGVGEQVLRSELKRASHLVRGDPVAAGATKGHIRYRYSGNELFADYVSLWVADPARAAELAPEFTRAFEAKVSSQSEVGALLRELKDRNVTAVPGGEGKPPKPPSPPKPEGAPEPEEFSETVPNPKAREEAFRVVREVTREHAAMMHRVNQASRKWAKEFSENQRKDIGAFIEGIGNLDKKGDTVQDVSARMTPAMRAAAKKYRFDQELLRQEVNKLVQATEGTPEFLNYVEDYLGHFYHKKGKGGKRLGELYTKWRKETPHSKQRVFPTYAEAVAAGFEPITQDFVYNYQRAAENNTKAATTRALWAKLKAMNKRAVAEGQVPLMTNNIASAGPGYVKVDHPVLRRVYARKTLGGKTILGEGSVWLHPDMVRPVKTILDKPFQGPLMHTLQFINSLGKSLNVAFSMFHEVTLYESSQAVDARFLNPLRGVVLGPLESRKFGFGTKPLRKYEAGHLLAEKDPQGIEDGIRSGLVESRSAAFDYARTFLETGLRKIENKAKRVPVLNWVTKWLRQGHEAYNRHLWDNVHGGMKLFSYHTVVKEMLDRPLPKGMTVRDVKETVASHINDAYGGQENLFIPTIRRGEGGKLRLKSEPMTVKERQIAQLLVFAPDWTWSNIRVAGRPIVNLRNPIMRKLGIRYWRNMSLNLMASGVLIQQVVKNVWGRDDPDMADVPWENEPDRKWDIDVTPLVRSIDKSIGREPSKERVYIHFGKQSREVLRYFSDFPKGMLEAVGNKSSVVVRMAVEQGAGHQLGSGFPMPWARGDFVTQLEGWDRVAAQAVSAAEHFIPFSWQPNNFAFAVPRRKGMTAYRAMRHYADAFKVQADPQSSTAKTKASVVAMEDVDGAAKANGIPQDRIDNLRSYAESRVRNTYYDRWYGAWESGDRGKMELWADHLVRMGARPSQVRGATKRRAMKEGRELTTEEKRGIGKIVRERRVLFKGR